MALHEHAAVRRSSQAALGLVAVLVLSAQLMTVPATAESAAAEGRGRNPGSYANPLEPQVPGDGVVESCADPTVIRGQQPGDTTWYMYCTTDPLNDEDLHANGSLVFHRIPTMTSEDLVDWTYVGDAFPLDGGDIPGWVDPTSAFWAPDVVYSSATEQYYLFVTVTETTAAGGGSDTCRGDSAIGVAVGDSPTGPWEFSDAPVVPPRLDPNGRPCSYLWTFDPDVLGDTVDDAGVLYYGSYYGGIFGTALTLGEDGAVADQTGAVQVAIDNKYEGANVVRRGDWYYLFASATNCCNGALTGYSVFVGRSADPLGPFLDREDVPLVDVQAGGTPVISMNGNRWVGTGHNTVFQDAAGDWWTIYHAVDQQDPFFQTAPGFTKRPALLDAIDWVDGWPTVNGGRWASDRRVPAPAGQEGERSRHRVRLVDTQEPRRVLTRASDEFSGTALDPAWSWVREEAATYDIADGVLTLDVQVADLNGGTNTASVLLRDAPRHDYVVETAVRLNVPDNPECCYNFAQVGLVVHEDDDNFVKLTNTSIFNTRQTEWAKELFPVPEGWNRYGNTVVGPPADAGAWTYLRIVVERLRGAEQREAGGDTEAYTAYSSRDGETWVRGGTWTHRLGPDARIGLVAMGLTPQFSGDYTADVDYVRVSTLRERPAR